METVSKMKYSRTDRLVLGIGYAILGLFVLSIVVPLVYVVLASFMDPTVLNNQGLSFHIKDWTLDAYRRVLENGMIWRGFLNSFLYSLAFAAISVFVTLLAAYPMSKKEFVGRKFFNVIFLITMFFGGGMIPTFILINQLHMVNTVWAILIPGAFNVWNMILARTYYQSIPKELREASAIDGANEIQHYGLCFTWDIANIDNNTDYVMLPALTGPEGVRNITRQNNSETSGFDRGRCVLTSSCRNTALAAAWIDQMYAPLQSPQNNWGSYGEKDSFNIFELSTNKDGGEMLKHLDLGDQSPVEVREAQSVNGPLAVLNEYYDMYVTQPADAKWRLDNMHETYLKDMKSKYVYPNVFMSIDDTNKVSQYDTDIKKYAEQKKADWILNGGIDKEWDSYLKKMEKYGLSDYLAIKQKYFDQYQESLKEEK